MNVRLSLRSAVRIVTAPVRALLLERLARAVEIAQPTNASGNNMSRR